MHSYGCATYLLHRDRRVVLFPVHGDFWHPDLEICAHQERFYGSLKKHCWNDLIVLRKGARCLAAALFNITNEMTTMGREARVRPGKSRTRVYKGGYQRAFPACPVPCC